MLDLDPGLFVPLSKSSLDIRRFTACREHSASSFGYRFKTQFIEKFNESSIPFVFIDVDIQGVNKLGYFGQDAEQSGLVAAHLMAQSLESGSNIMILKQTNNKIFSQHIEAREIGFRKYFEDDKAAEVHHIVTVEIDLFQIT